jgi:hypothetical protein
VDAPNYNRLKFSSAFLISTKSGHHPRARFVTKEPIMFALGPDNLFVETWLLAARSP